MNNIEGDADFIEAVDIVTQNTGGGGIWLIGGFVYRSIASSLYQLPKPRADLDLIVENPLEKLELPGSWTLSKNSYGNPKFIKKSSGVEIDFIPITAIHSIIRRGLQPTIENFLSGTPLNVQSICYDVKNKKVIGETGIKAIMGKTVRINDIVKAAVYSEKKGKSINQIIKEKASALGFRAIFLN